MQNKFSVKVGNLVQGGGAPCIGYRTISFSVKIQSPFFCSEMATLDYLGYFMMNKIVIFLFKVWKKWISKTGKMKKTVKNSQFWACFGVFEWLNLFRLNFAPAVKLYFLSFLRIMMGGNLKSPAITRNKIFCVKNVAFLPNHKVFWVKMYLKSNIRHTIDWNYFEILNSHLYFLTRIKKK